MVLCLQMGNGNSKDTGPETPGLMGKLGGIPRAAAITEGRRAKGGQPKLPPNAVRSQPDDWAFIEVHPSLCAVPEPSFNQFDNRCTMFLLPTTNAASFSHLHN